MQRDPTFQGAVGIYKDLALDERGWHWVDYGSYYHVNGVGFTHIPFNPSNGKPISGVDICRKASMVVGGSVVFGHTHQLNYSQFNRVGQDTQRVLSAGCFFDHKPHYVNASEPPWWTGVLMLYIEEDSSYRLTTYPLDYLKEYHG